MPRDKFAALASRAADNNSTDTTPAGQEGQNAPAAASTNSTQPPARRDKLAALAARASTPTAEEENAQSTAGSNNNSGAPRDKFASLAKRAGTTQVSEAPQPSNEEDKAKEERLKEIKERLSKRQQILENLNQAEEMTCKLLEVAHKTCTALQDLNCSTNISELSKTYRSTLQAIHPLLSTDTEKLIHPYQNHSNETKQSMYGARVEMRLARERTEVLKAFTELERNQCVKQDETLNVNKKRPREDETGVTI